MRGVDRLLELQELDSAIDRLEARKRQMEEGKEIADARAAMEDAEGRLGELRLGVDAVAREQQRLEREIDSMTRKAEVDEKRLYDGSIANIKEMEALQHEITSLKERRSRSEDELLEQRSARTTSNPGRGKLAPWFSRPGPGSMRWGARPWRSSRGSRGSWPKGESLGRSWCPSSTTS